MARFLFALVFAIFLAGCATTPRYSVTTVREPKTKDRVRVELVFAEIVESAQTSRILKRLDPKWDGTISSLLANSRIESTKTRAAIAELLRCSDAKVKDFPTLIVADGERREADCQRPMRYASEWNEPTDDSWPTPKTWTTRGVGMKWSCEAEIEGDKVTIKTDPEYTQFDGYVEYRTYRVKNGREAVHMIKQPIFSKRALNTSVTMWSGSTIALGGLIREDSVSQDGHQETRKINHLIFLSADLVDEKGRPKANPG